MVCYGLESTTGGGCAAGGRHVLERMGTAGEHNGRDVGDVCALRSRWGPRGAADPHSDKERWYLLIEVDAWSVCPGVVSIHVTRQRRATDSQQPFLPRARFLPFVRSIGGSFLVAAWLFRSVSLSSTCEQEELMPTLVRFFFMLERGQCGSSDGSACRSMSVERCFC